MTFDGGSLDYSTDNNENLSILHIHFTVNAPGLIHFLSLPLVCFNPPPLRVPIVEDSLLTIEHIFKREKRTISQPCFFGVSTISRVPLSVTSFLTSSDKTLKNIPVVYGLKV